MSSHGTSASTDSSPPSPAAPALPQLPFRSVPLAYLPPRHPHSHPYPAHLHPGMDPSSVDFRAFYPYIPNEIKHRKRTTSAQLKVLENIFKRDTKPNAALRKELAAQLDMPPRGVQVWFQNRRAKEKTKATKLSTGKTGPSNSASLSPSAGSSDDTEISPEAHQERHASMDMSSSAPSPAARMSLRLDTDSSTKSWNSSPSHSPRGVDYLDDAHLLAIRRGSLPANAFPASGAQSFGVSPLDPLARRRSVDVNVRRLEFNPYASLARAKNVQAYASRFPGSYPQHLSVSSSLDRPSLTHRSTAPNDLSQLRHSSMDSRVRYAGRSVPSEYQSRTSLPPYIISTRSIPSPTPGPLPAPGFSFGIATPSPADSERNSPDSYMYRRDEQEMDDDASASYDGFSRFGSMASMTSESSNTSANFSDISSGAAGYAVDYSRRASCASGHFSEMMSGLVVNGNEEDGIRLAGPYSSREDITAAVALEGSLLLQGRDGELQCERKTYPSPSPTVSPSGSPQSLDGTAIIPISRSSELTYALHSKPDHTQEAPGFDHSPSSSASPHPIGPFFYTPAEGLATNESSGSSIVVPSLEYADKFQYEETNQYQASYASEQSYPSFNARAQEGGIEGGIEFPTRGPVQSDTYSGYSESTESPSSMGQDAYLGYP